MGPIDSWRPFLQETKERGYNMIHYTPLQQRGESNSPYSISEQLAYDRTLFGPDVKDTEGGVKRVEEFLKMAKDEYGLLSLTDVVLNHTANNSDWLQDHPEAGFSPFNTPHLAPAVEIDDAMIDFSANLASRGLPTNIQSSEDLDKVMEAFKETFKSLNLWQYYVLDVDRERRAVQEALNSEVPAWEGPDLAGKDVAFIAETIRNRKLVAGLGGFAKRFGVYVDPKIAASAIRAAFRELNDKEALAAAWGKVADVLNVDLYEEANGDQVAALDGIKNRVSYARLDSNGPKLGEITKE
jgi:glycogen debranching enzyme